MAHSLNFTQDDAYISYRYVANFLNGDGLVYNLGERIEGFTNFGWVIYLILWGAFDLDFIVVSKVTGFLFGGATIFITWLTACRIFGGHSRWLALLPTYLVGFNLSYAYWSAAGLETATFTFFVTLSLYLYITRSWWLVFSLLLSVLLRPEGVLVTGMLISIELVTIRKFPRFTLTSAAVVFVLCLPLVVFKLIYYGSIFPNPFYAKTSMSLEQVKCGLIYAGEFLSNYGVYGVGFLVPLLCMRKLSRNARALWLFAVFYTLYIVLVGGDVLKVQRFFMPIVGTAAVLISLSVWMLIHRLRPRLRITVFTAVAVGLLATTYLLPKSLVYQYNVREKSLTGKMSFLARQMKQTDSRDFSTALATIGIFGYELLGHDIIDLLGLTDSNIARHPGKPIEGMETTWRERRHNARYVLGRAPDYIVFSTGQKPSAPAEQELMLFAQFVNSYRTVGWSHQYDENNPARASLVVAFKKVRDLAGDPRATYPVDWVRYYKAGLECYPSGDHVRAIELFDQAIKASGEPCFPYLPFHQAYSLMMMGRDDLAIGRLNAVLAQDSLVFEAHKYLYFYAFLSGDTEKAAVHERWLKLLVPRVLAERKIDSRADGCAGAMIGGAILI